ncbi:hypothetical protein HDF16_006130 [Granulicella aggregans]|uniref:Uncharacterized protein n=1 Tax=Granulicella aggregans TaxID=474949 RepID=A0A7W7ZKS2_9BACT|nr:hypothetical protein [Granulicella aggregans]
MRTTGIAFSLGRLEAARLNALHMGATAQSRYRSLFPGTSFSERFGSTAHTDSSRSTGERATVGYRNRIAANFLSVS